MLNRDDAALVARERAIPGLALLLDPDAFADLVADTPDAARFAGARATYLRFKPGTRALAAFASDSDAGSVAFYALAHGPDAPTKEGDGGLHFPKRAISLFPFPRDRRLRALVRLSSQERQSRLLERIFADDPELARGELRTLTYKPERRLVARLVVNDREAAVLKFHGAAAFYPAWTRSDALRHCPFPRLPEIIGRSRKHRVIAYRWRDGDLLRGQLGHPGGRRALEMTGAALAEFHQIAKPRVTLAGRAALPDLEESTGALRAIAPAQSAYFEALEKRLQASLLGSRPSVPVLCHGDFYAKQVLVSRCGVDFLDFDRAGWADAHHDLAVFWAHLERDALSSRSAGEAADHLDALLEGYRRIRAVDPGRLAHCAAAALFSIAMHPFRNRESDWRERSMALVERAAAISERAEITRFPPPTPATHGIPPLAAALDPERARPAIASALGPAFPVVGEGALLRRKPGRRALVRYPVPGSESGEPTAWIGKIRAKGLDARAYDTYCRLFHCVEASPSPRAFAVPEPIGSVPTLGMWLQCEERGWPAAAVLGSADGARAATHIADALHAFHGLDFPAPGSHDAGDEWRILKERLRRATCALPEYGERIALIAERCHSLIGPLANAHAVTGIHRDFYPDQVLAYGDRIILLDFDLCTRGDPALDVGNFVAHLEELSLREPRRAAALCESAKVFLGRYLSLSEDTALRQRVESYRLLSIARHIDISTRIPERRGISETLIASCEYDLSISRLEEQTS